MSLKHVSLPYNITMQTDQIKQTTSYRGVPQWSFSMWSSRLWRHARGGAESRAQCLKGVQPKLRLDTPHLAITHRPGEETLRFTGRGGGGGAESRAQCLKGGQPKLRLDTPHLAITHRPGEVTLRFTGASSGDSCVHSRDWVGHLNQGRYERLTKKRSKTKTSSTSQKHIHRTH